MAFSEAQYKSVIDNLVSGLDDLNNKLAEVPGKATHAANQWWVPPWLAEAVIWCGKKMIELGSWLLKTIKELLEGAVAPVYMFIHAEQWVTVQSMSNTVAADIQPSTLGAVGSWTGDAATAYGNEIGPQSAAATSVGSIANAASNALLTAAAAGLAFYIGIAAIVVKFVMALTAAIVAFGTAVFSWAGLLIVVEEAGVNTAAIGGLVAGLVALLGGEAATMVQLDQGLAVNPTFPGGHWPPAASGS